MAHAIQIDTLAFAKRLQAAGADERLAEAIVEGITDADTSSLATKEDIALVKEDLRHVETALKEDIALVRTELKEDIALVKEDIRQVETTLKEDIALVRTELKEDIALVKDDVAAIKTDIANSHADILKWLFGIIFAQTAIVIAVFSFLLN